MSCSSKGCKSCKCDDGFKKVTMWELELDLDVETVEKLKAIAIKEIANDEQGLLQYIVPKLLLQYIEKQKSQNTKDANKVNKTKKTKKSYPLSRSCKKASC